MARAAVIEYPSMLEERRRECRRVMADGTVLGRRQVVDELADTDDVVVA